MSPLSKGKYIHKRLTMLTLLTTAVVLAGCTDKESEEVPTEPAGEVVVNNGQVTEDVEGSEEEVSTESEESVPKREVHQDKVPKTTRETLTWGDELDGESTETGTDTATDNAPDLSQEYVTVNEGQPEGVNYDSGYTLYYPDENKRSVGGEGVVSLSTLDQRPGMEEGEEDKLYSYPMLHTGLFKDERGLETRNQVNVTKQAYNLLTELNQNIYDTVKNTQSDNHVYVSIEALYMDGYSIPYGIHYQAQSVHGDIHFNYIVNNIQPGLTVNYTEGTVEEGVSNE